MASPFDAVRRAVAGGRPAAPAFVGSEPAVARPDAAAGGLVARYPATAYARFLDHLTTTCSVVCPVTVYAGAATPAARLTIHGDGSQADYSPPTPRLLPGGVPLLIVWSTTTAGATASANAQFRQAV